MDFEIIDIRNRPAFLHDFYGARDGTPSFDVARWLNGRTGSADPTHFVRSRTVDGWLDGIAEAGIGRAVVIGRDTPDIRNDNDEIARLAAVDPRIVGVGSVDPQRLGATGAVEEAERALGVLGLAAVNVEPGFGAPPIAFDAPALMPLYEALAARKATVFLMSGPTMPDLALNDPAAVGRIARAFPDLTLAVHHGLWPRAAEIVGVAFRYPNVVIVPDMYIFQPAGRLYVEAANGALADQVAFGSSHPFRAMRQSVEDYLRLGFSDDVLPKVMGGTAARILGLA